MFQALEWFLEQNRRSVDTERHRRK